MRFDGLRERKSEYAHFMHDEITHVCKNMDKRVAGSDGEKQAVDYMATQLSTCCDDISIEPFKVNPAAFMGWIYFTVSCIIMAFVSYFFSSMLCIVLLVVGILPMIGEFVLYKRMTDPLYPEKISHNITAVKHCHGEVKKRIFFNGHVDAVNEWAIHRRFGGIVFILQVIMAIIGVAYLFALALAHWIVIGGVGADIAGGEYLYAGLAALVFLPSWIMTYFFCDPKRVVDGANDNLSGCYLSIAIMKALKDSGVEFENTEVGVIITGSEEAGLRGAKAWCEQHNGLYDDAQTIIVAFDTLRDGKYLQVNRRDMNGIVKTDSAVADLFIEAAKAVDINMGSGSVPMGATDSAAFNQGGFRSVGITALDHVLPSYYHTRYDSYDNMNEDCLADCFEVSLKALEMWTSDVEHKQDELNDAMQQQKSDIKHEDEI